MWFNGPPEDEYGRYKPEAYAYAIVFMSLIGIGLILIAIY